MGGSRSGCEVGGTGLGFGPPEESQTEGHDPCHVRDNDHPLNDASPGIVRVRRCRCLGGPNGQQYNSRGHYCSHRECPPQERSPFPVMTETQRECETADRPQSKRQCPEGIMQFAVQTHLGRRNGYRIHDERAGKHETASNDREERRAQTRGPSFFEFSGDTSCEQEKRQADNNEIRHLNPAARPKRERADKHAGRPVAGAQPALHCEDRNEKRGTRDSRPCSRSATVWW